MPLDKLQINHWDDIELETVNPYMKRRIATGELMTVARVYLADGYTVPMHSHHNEQVTQVISGKMHFVFGENRDKEQVLGPGDCVVIPAHLPHEATAIGDVEEMDMWAPRREDWLDGSNAYLTE
jgi:quercetin dioxygenase-like cupin family protein